jgi:hypothetical protein
MVGPDQVNRHDGGWNEGVVLIMTMRAEAGRVAEFLPARTRAGRSRLRAPGPCGYACIYAVRRPPPW